MNTLIIDNYDSFTYNLFQLVSELKLGEVIVRLNDQVTLRDLSTFAIDAIIISPGPGNPNNPTDIGNCEEIILKSGLPVFGVCLGMQCLVRISGGKVEEADEPVHGQVDNMLHDGSALFNGIPSSFKAMRYHSLIATQVPEQWRVCARNPQGIVMAVAHQQRPWWGVQFHPESIATEFGTQLMANFFQLIRSNSRRTQSINVSQKCRPHDRPKTPEKPTRQWTIHWHECDWADPETVFLNLYQSSAHCFWLDSSMLQKGLSRYSIMGDCYGEHAYTAVYHLAGQQWTVTKNGKRKVTHQAAFDWIKQELNAQQLVNPHPELPFQGGFLGWLGYELKAECGASIHHHSKWPDAALFFSDRYLIFDHQKQKLILVCLLPGKHDSAAATRWFSEMAARINTLPQSNPLSPEVASRQHTSQVFRTSLQKEYVTKVEAARRFIKQGLSYELCLTRRLDIPCDLEGIKLYQRLRRHNPAPYASFIRLDNLEVLSSSPEQFLKIDKNGNISSKPIKGTIARAEQPDRDLANLNQLRSNIKDRAENLMIVDLLRNDLGKVCDSGSVKVSQLLQVETYATLHQLVSQITGHINPRYHLVDCIQAAFPGGSMTGAPKLRSMELLEQLENDWRGIYSGCTGYLSLHQTCDLSINIRGIVLDQGHAYIGSGGAVVWLSQANAEFEEMLLKAQALFDVIE